MRLARSVSFSKQRSDNRRLSNSRTRKKHKRLDAICERTYNINHHVTEAQPSGLAGNEAELRRSSRVRRAPVILDASPRPAKKRQRIDKDGNDSVDRVKMEDDVQIESPCSTSRGTEEETPGWRSRLRSRAKNVSVGVKGKRSFTSRGKRKLFEDVDSIREEPNLAVDKKEVPESRKSTVVKSKRPGRVQASNSLRNRDQAVVLLDSSEEDEEKNEVVLENNNEDQLQSKSAMELGSEVETKDGMDAEMVEKEEDASPSDLRLENSDLNNQVETTVQDIQKKPPANSEEEENQRDATEFGGVPADRGSNDKPLEVENAVKVDKITSATDTLGKPRIKEGRRCGLCGGGTDGKPPRKLAHNGAGSETEACSGSSTSDEANYDIWDGFGDEPGWLGRVLGPINDRYGIAGIWVHQHCAVWSPEVYFAGLGCLKNVRAALCRGRVLKCSRCGRRGATIGCRVDRCPKTYHLPCARANGCIFDHRKFLIACTDHRHLFQPHGSNFLCRVKKMKAKKVKLEMRKLSTDAWRKDLEAEEKWLENCGEDEEFLRRENKRFQRDLLRIAPVYIGGSNSKDETNYQGWESVAGLQNVIQCMKEVVILPLLYPEFFGNMGITPPRGVLLHGHPGTGKTLVVRALIGSCARGDKRIAYFARKGADCLGKYVGDAERQLRLLFQVAEKSQPSIIFFDEIDGLAPSRTRQQDQTHSSVVSTLLALMDGLKSRGSVVVIGATNRPDAVDPALRRPGRFDREIYFPLPSVQDRAAILSLHTQKWPKPVSGSLLNWIARRTVGFAGADLQALCTQAAIISLRRNCTLKELLSTAGEKAPHGKRPPLPAFMVEERDWLEAISCVPPPCSRREAGMAANDVISSPLYMHLSPCLLQPLSILVLSLYLDERLWLPSSLFKAATNIKGVILSTLDKKKIKSDQWWSYLHDLLQDPDVLREIENSLLYGSILVGDNSHTSGDDSDADTTDKGALYEKSNLLTVSTRSTLLRNVSYASGKKSGFRILISGSPRCGQKYLASCLLHCFVGNVELRKIDFATISQEGHGDAVVGLTQILMGCAGVSSCLIFMPRIDLWAIEPCHQAAHEEESDSSSVNLESFEENETSVGQSEVETRNQSCTEECESGNEAEPQDDEKRSSHIWSLFVEQVESIRLSSSLIILATSEEPFPQLPLQVRQFFQCDMLNNSLSTPLVDTVPRFSVQLEGNFNRETVINSSAAELSKDLVHQFVKLVHYRVHLNANSRHGVKACDIVGQDAKVECQGAYPVSATEQGSSIPQNPKGKSSLLLAISTLGYQILRYPHFAELCWVTSKLRVGPTAGVNGPWRGWPFNSCVVRPCNNITAGKEEKPLVRGLVAVGLSASRGAYNSLREICSEIRTVLELLAREVNAKIQAGKNRYQFVRIMSQVAYLEDMVSSWAHTLQSFEVVDTQMIVGNDCNNSLPNTDGCELNLPSKTSNEGVVLEELPNGRGANNNNIGRFFDLDKGSGDSRFPNIEEENIIANTNGYPHDIQNVKKGGGDLERNGLSTDPENYTNGYANTDIDTDTDTVVLLKDDGACSIKSNGVKFSTSGKDNGKMENIGIPHKDDDGDDNSKFEKQNIDTDRGVVCMYKCCPYCVYDLRQLMQKILRSEWGTRVDDDWRVEDVHDSVASLSVRLHSALRKLFVSSESSIMPPPVECTSCHSTTTGSGSETAIDSKLMFRDGVLVAEEAKDVTNLHCKFETLCLCSLIEWIRTTKSAADTN